MAVIVNPVQTRMVLAYETGTGEDGKVIITKKTYSNVKANAQNDAFYQVGIGYIRDK